MGKLEGIRGIGCATPPPPPLPPSSTDLAPQCRRQQQVADYLPSNKIDARRGRRGGDTPQRRYDAPPEQNRGPFQRPPARTRAALWFAGAHRLNVCHRPLPHGNANRLTDSARSRAATFFFFFLYIVFIYLYILDKWTRVVHGRIKIVERCLLVMFLLNYEKKI